VRVTQKKIEAWLENKQIVDVLTAGRRVSVRIEVEESKPLGIACWRTRAAVRNIKIRRLEPSLKEQSKPADTTAK
jgi:hypothetical protein